MSYGTPTADTGSQYLGAGVFPVKIESIEILTLTGDKYNGPAIDINYVGADGTANDRLFPLNVEWETEKYNKQSQNTSDNMAWFNKSYPDLNAYLDHERGQTVSNKVRDILSTYLSEEEVNNFFAEVQSMIAEGTPEQQAFQILGQQFAKWFNNNPALAQKEVFLARGYTWNKDFPSGPRYAKDCKPWIHSQPFNFKGGKQFKLTPFGDKLRGQAPSQNQEVEEDF